MPSNGLKMDLRALQEGFMLSPIDSNKHLLHIDREGRSELRKINRLATRIERAKINQVKLDNRTDSLYIELQKAVDSSGLEVSTRVKNILEGK